MENWTQIHPDFPSPVIPCLAAAELAPSPASPLRPIPYTAGCEPLLPRDNLNVHEGARPSAWDAQSGC